MSAISSRVFVVALAFSAPPSLSQAAATDHPTLDKGYKSVRAPDKGVLLHLHGCGGLSTRGINYSWINHLEKNGFKVYAPDSFAEKRPRKACAAPFPNKKRIYQIRLRQTRAVIKILKRRYPDKPLYIWGHSEGGGLANTIRDRVDGIITTGYQCGFRSTRKTSVRRDVRLLVLIGSTRYDHYIRGSLRHTGLKSMSSLCKRAINSSNWRWRSFSHLGHAIPMWDPAVLEVVNAFLGISGKYTGADGYPAKAKTKDMWLSARAKATFQGKYRKRPRQKAFAIGPMGSFGWATNRGNLVDARSAALYYCNRAANRRTYNSGQRCVIYAVNSKAVLKE